MIMNGEKIPCPKKSRILIRICVSYRKCMPADLSFYRLTFIKQKHIIFRLLIIN